ncbi:hypothetical protein HMPREF1624_02161 [Sporothrix schenckii ATCC 58251]|uniref:Uncharacterized protein n=1 Tax=Sporothrix schenckii (strain ATCC 58251 / de Perez 2211183) TaxID=1391915 RepID=U7Q187_SPOS1|nr:hypothetical protein HMPREF1624_02161 [Sporothrix schenckii ATCC 58251]
MARDDIDKGASFKYRFKWPLTSWKPSAAAGPITTPPWLPLPKIVMASFGLNLLMILIGLVVSGLELGGTIVVNAKAIGLTESLVMISCIFGLVYMICYMLVSRRPDPFEGSNNRARTPRHTKIIVLGRITIVLWSVSLLASAITLSTRPAAGGSSTTPLQAGLAAAVINCLDMTIVEVVVERTLQPFVLPWITPPIPEGQTSAAKALIDGILGDGISGHPYAASSSGGESGGGALGRIPSRTSSEEEAEEEEDDDDEEEEEPAPPPAPIPSKRKRKTRVTIRETSDDPNVSTSTLGPPPSVPSYTNEPFAMPSSGSTLVERQELWSRVDEGAAKPSSIKLPPPPPMHQNSFAPAAGSYILPVPSPMEHFYPPQPTYMSSTAQIPSPGPVPMMTPMPPRPPLSRTSASGFPRYSAAPMANMSHAPPAFGVMGTRPLYEAGRMHSYTAYINSLHGNGTIAEEEQTVDDSGVGGSGSGGSTNGERSDGTRSVPVPMGARPPPPRPIRGRKMFNKAIQDLKASNKREEPIWDDYSTIRVPGSYV